MHNDNSKKIDALTKLKDYLHLHPSYYRWSDPNQCIIGSLMKVLLQHNHLNDDTYHPDYILTEFSLQLGYVTGKSTYKGRIKECLKPEAILTDEVSRDYFKSAVVDICPIVGLPLHEITESLKEHGFTAQELMDFETLNNRKYNPFISESEVTELNYLNVDHVIIYIDRWISDLQNVSYDTKAISV